MESDTKQLNYTTINHVARMELGLTWIEYGLADLIHNLSNNNKSENRWCYASKQTLADQLGVSKRYIHKIVNKLILLGLIEKHESTKYVRTTNKWFEMVIINKSEQNSLSVNKVPSDGEQSSLGGVNKVPTTRIYNKDNYKRKEKEIDKEKEKKRSLTTVSSLSPPKYRFLENLTSQDFEEIAQKYQVPLSFVMSKFDDMMLWAGSRPSNSKLKDRNWRLTLMKFVKDDAFKIRERSMGDPTKRSVDARNL